MLHLHFNSIGFEVDLESAITISDIELAIRTLGFTVASRARNRKVSIANLLVSKLHNLINNVQQIVTGDLELTVIT